VIPQLWDASERYRRWAIRLRGLPESRWAEHATIVELMRAGDAQGASDALSGHLTRTLDMLGSTLRKEQR
jgi:DNA-binding GntR family transcriptional regulator